MSCCLQEGNRWRARSLTHTHTHTHSVSHTWLCIHSGAGRGMQMRSCADRQGIICAEYFAWKLELNQPSQSLACLMGGGGRGRSRRLGRRVLSIGAWKCSPFPPERRLITDDYTPSDGSDVSLPLPPTRPPTHLPPTQPPAD